MTFFVIVIVISVIVIVIIKNDDLNDGPRYSPLMTPRRYVIMTIFDVTKTSYLVQSLMMPTSNVYLVIRKADNV